MFCAIALHIDFGVTQSHCVERLYFSFLDDWSMRPDVLTESPRGELLHSFESASTSESY